MLTEICGYLNNFFVETQYVGAIDIIDGDLFCNGKKIPMEAGQYFTLVNDKAKAIVGVFLFGTDTPNNRSIADGAVWIMDIPPLVLEIATDVAAWMEKNGTAESAALSPYNSEAFATYSYSKSSGADSSGSSASVPIWWKSYGGRLSRWRRL